MLQATDGEQVAGVAADVPVEVALVPGRVVARRARVAPRRNGGQVSDRRGRRHQRRRRRRRRRMTGRNSISGGRGQGSVYGGVAAHERPAPEATAAARAGVPGPRPVLRRHVVPQRRLVGERATAALEGPRASLVHRRSVTFQVVLAVRRVRAVAASVLLAVRRRPWW